MTARRRKRVSERAGGEVGRHERGKGRREERGERREKREERRAKREERREKGEWAESLTPVLVNVLPTRKPELLLLAAEGRTPLLLADDQVDILVALFDKIVLKHFQDVPFHRPVVLAVVGKRKLVVCT